MEAAEEAANVGTNKCWASVAFKQLGMLSGKSFTNVVPVFAILGLISEQSPLLVEGKITGGAPGKFQKKVNLSGEELIDALKDMLGRGWHGVHIENGICEATREHPISNVLYAGVQMFDLDDEGALVKLGQVPPLVTPPEVTPEE